MVESKHTPGPWRAGTDEIGYKRCYSGLAIYSAERLLIGESAGGFPDGTAEANALLMAAAPDLLAALQACYDQLTSVNAHFYRDGEWSEVTMARAASAKATGAA